LPQPPSPPAHASADLSLLDLLGLDIGLVALTSFAVALALVLTKNLHGRFSMDGSEGVQKFHDAPTPRVGGIALMISAILSVFLFGGEMRGMLTAIVLAGIPAFAAGLLEDITKTVSPRDRLLATMASGAIFAIVFGQAFALADLQWVQNYVSLGWPVYAFTIVLLCVGMAGVANAVNIVDGFHGLASGSLVIMHGAFALIAMQVGDLALAGVAMVLAATSAGFMVVNFPFGKIFLGDAGAYFAGFSLAAVAVLATTRNEAISPFVSLLVIFYPVYETLFSIHRKRRREGHSPSQPDGVHMHMLVSRSLARPLAGWIGRPRSKNALTGALMWMFPLICAVMGVASAGSGRAAVIGWVVFAMLYGRMYLIVSLQRSPVLNIAERALVRRAARRDAS